MCVEASAFAKRMSDGTSLPQWRCDRKLIVSGSNSQMSRAQLFFAAVMRCSNLQELGMIATMRVFSVGWCSISCSMRLIIRSISFSSHGGFA